MYDLGPVLIELVALRFNGFIEDLGGAMSHFAEDDDFARNTVPDAMYDAEAQMEIGSPQRGDRVFLVYCLLTAF